MKSLQNLTSEELIELQGQYLDDEDFETAEYIERILENRTA